MPTTVSLLSQQLEANLIRLDVLIQDAPLDLFGVAFHLKITGAKWDLAKWETGTIFPTSLQPLTLVSKQQDPSEIIVGLSLKRGYKAASQDGKLVSFYLQTSHQEPLTFEFTEGVISTFQAQRKDLQNVTWENSTFVPINLAHDTKTAIVAPSKNGIYIDNSALIEVYTVIFGAFLLAVLLTAIYLILANKKKYR